MTETISAYCVVEPTDMLFINFFTERQSCNKWVSDDNRLGEAIAGPFTVEKRETPFEIVIGCNITGMIEDMFINGEEPDDVFEQFDTVLGPYTVYQSIEEFEQNL